MDNKIVIAALLLLNSSYVMKGMKPNDSRYMLSPWRGNYNRQKDDSSQTQSTFEIWETAQLAKVIR